MKRQTAWILAMAAAAMLTLAPMAQAERRYTIRSGRTWDEHALNAVGRMAQRGATLRHLYRDYRDRRELLNRQRLDQGLPPVEIKSFRDWRRVK